MAEQATGTPKTTNSTVESVRLLRLARRSAIKGRTQAANQIHSVIDTAPEELRAQLIVLPAAIRIARCARLRPADVATPLGAAKLALVSLARRRLALDAEADMLAAELGRLVALAAPGLIAVKGVGTEVAGALLAAAGDNPERLATRPASPPCAARRPSRRPRGVTNATGSTVAGTAKPTAPSAPACAMARVVASPMPDDAPVMRTLPVSGPADWA